MHFSSLLLAALSVAPSIARPAMAPAGVDLFYGWKTFCSDPHAKFPANTYHICFDGNTGPKAEVVWSEGSVSVYTNEADKAQFAIVLWNKDSMATVQVGRTQINVDPDDEAGPACVRYDIQAGYIRVGDYCPPQDMVGVPQPSH